MELQLLLDTLRSHEAELRRAGIDGLRVFGSVARGEARDSSDVDLAARLENGRAVGLYELARIERYIEGLIGREVDLITEHSRMKPRLRAEIERDHVVAF
jgi:uncharacterized protein